MTTNLLKRCWKASPQTLRLLAFKALCVVQAERRSAALPKDGPLYVCGAFYNKCGIAHGSRLYVQQCREQGQDVIPVDITAAMRLRYELACPENPLSVSDLRSHTQGGTVVIHANPPQFQLAICALGKDFLRHKSLIAYWAWELEELPPIWRQALDYTDAIEVPSTFVQQALQRVTDKSVTVRPHAVPQPSRRKTEYAPDGIVRCLYIFDVGSTFERKNPLAVLQAFQKAFAPGEARLTFKVSNIEAQSCQFTEFCNICSAFRDVRILTGCMEHENLTELYLKHDIYISLHRSEGYGLTIREAMLHGLHVVATGWSGNMDFMQGELAHIVPYKLVPVEMHSGAFRGIRSRWAEADIEKAAEILAELKRRLTS